MGKSSGWTARSGWRLSKAAAHVGHVGQHPSAMTVSADPRALLQQAALHDRNGRLPKAIATYERLLRQWPALSDSWYNLKLLQRRAGHFEAALASYQHALAFGVAQPEEVHLNRGAIYSDGLRRSADAERELTAALQINPPHIPALLKLGNLHEDQAWRDSALALYERLLALDPACHEALALRARQIAGWMRRLRRSAARR